MAKQSLHHFLLKSGSTLAAVRPAATSAKIKLRLYRRTSFLLCSTAALRAFVSLQPEHEQLSESCTASLKPDLGHCLTGSARAICAA